MARRFPFLICLILLVAPISSRACTCSPSPPGQCPGLQKGDTVFLGTVTEIEILRLQTQPSANTDAASATDVATSSLSGASGAAPVPVTRYHFRVDENFIGADSAEIDVFSGGDDADCAFRFREGAQYVVFPHKPSSNSSDKPDDTRLFATICSGTRLASEAQALLPQLRAMRNGQRVASVFGVIRRADPPMLGPPDDPAGSSDDSPPADPRVSASGALPNIPLKLRSRIDRFATTTDDNGVYSFYDVHAGEYSLTATMPARTELTLKTLPGALPPLRLPNGACYEYDIDALPIGHIRGSVLGPDGKPLALAAVELYRAGHYDESHSGLWSFQGAKGIFDFDHVGPGEYILVFNRQNRMDPNAPFPRSFYPGTTDAQEAEPIVLKDGQQILHANMKLGDPFPTRKLRIRLKWTGASPAGSIVVTAKATQGINPAVRKISEGVYEMTLLQDAHYNISAFEELSPSRARPGAPRTRKGSRTAAPNCTPPPRIETPPAEVDGSAITEKEITLTFAKPGCAEENQ
jgi:hypothetical protein